MTYGIRSLRKRMRANRKGVERWYSEHKLAIDCMDFEVLIKAAVSDFDAINSFDESWRVQENTEPKDYKQFQRLVMTLFKIWIKTENQFLEKIALFERKDFVVKYAEEYRSACREVNGIFTEDSDFFKSEKLGLLQDAALVEYHNDECTPL